MPVCDGLAGERSRRPARTRSRGTRGSRSDECGEGRSSRSGCCWQVPAHRLAAKVNPKDPAFDDQRRLRYGRRLRRRTRREQDLADDGDARYPRPIAHHITPRRRHCEARQLSRRYRGIVADGTGNVDAVARVASRHGRPARTTLALLLSGSPLSPCPPATARSTSATCSHPVHRLSSHPSTLSPTSAAAIPTTTNTHAKPRLKIRTVKRPSITLPLASAASKMASAPGSGRRPPATPSPRRTASFGRRSKSKAMS